MDSKIKNGNFICIIHSKQREGLPHVVNLQYRRYKLSIKQLFIKKKSPLATLASVVDLNSLSTNLRKT